MVEIITKECIDWVAAISDAIERYDIVQPTRILAGEDGIVFLWVNGDKYLELCCHYSGVTTFLKTARNTGKVPRCDTLKMHGEILTYLVTISKAMEQV